MACVVRNVSLRHDCGSVAERMPQGGVLAELLSLGNLRDEGGLFEGMFGVLG